MKIHEKKEKTHQCEECSENFRFKYLLEAIMKKQHIECDSKTPQFNCKDCPFQGEDGLQLRKHVQRTQHTPNEFIEGCYNCKEKFSSYWLLMNHRKKEHPSNRMCRFFLENRCIFDENECWFRHLDHNLKGKEMSKFQCKECDDTFSVMSDLIKHKKTKHPEKVSKCKEFAQGNCQLDGKLPPGKISKYSS